MRMLRRYTSRIANLIATSTALFLIIQGMAWTQIIARYLTGG